MMLPSGNDAAYALAEHFGHLLEDRKQVHIIPTCPSPLFINTPVKHFLKEMNHQAHKLKMTHSHYDSPHGLMNKSNYSTAEDQAILVAEVMKLEPFRKIVNTREYKTKALNGLEGRKNVTEYTWTNTNKLLGKMDGLLGCKTGITQAAGHCFAGYYEDKNLKIAIILCHSRSLEDRWIEVQKMVEWAKIQRIKTKELQNREAKIG